MVVLFVDGDKQQDRQLLNVRFSQIVGLSMVPLTQIVLYGDLNASQMELNASISLHVHHIQLKQLVEIWELMENANGLLELLQILELVD